MNDQCCYYNSFQFAVVKTASSHDAAMAKTLCSGLKDGEFVVFDKAYVDFAHLFELFQRGILWISRAKTIWSTAQ